MKIDLMHISGFKSVADMRLEELSPFSVFAGPNGAGKSNIMDAMAFVSALVELGATKALRHFRGFAQVHCYKLRKENTRTFSFKLHASLREHKLEYALKVHDMDTNPQLEELLLVDGKKRIERKKNG